MTRTDGMGTWESTDDGRSWTLTEPSAEFLAERAAATPPETQPTAEERLAELEAIVAALIEEAP